MDCPRCDIELHGEVLTAAGVTVQCRICSKCGGQWFDKGQLDVQVVEIRHIPSHEQQIAPLSCPVCESVRLQKVESQRDAKVIMDVCPDCSGTWLDGGELRAIQQESLPVALANLWRWMKET